MSESATPHGSPGEKLRLAGLIGVLGVVYGDIGTSPLYAVQASLSYFPGNKLQESDVLGLLSLIFWALIITVTIKYVLLIMRADNEGEGGTLSLMALAQRVTQSDRTKWIIGIIGICGAGLFFGDATITPAISVLSAVEGMEVVSPGLKEFVLPIAIAVILVLFFVQRFGTARVGGAFGPIMVIWFVVIGALGLHQIFIHPNVLRALVPVYGAAFIMRHDLLAFIALGSVVLAVTGAEALYADMGHFGAKPIRVSWLFFVLPCLLLNYFGQGALVIRDPHAASNPFFFLLPHALVVPMVILATIATVIASQAVISGAYSVARQSTQLGLLPRMPIRYTNETEQGQIYVPPVNSFLFVVVVLLVLGFGSSSALASAYGIAVTGTFLSTNALAAFVYCRHFNWPLRRTVLVFGAIGLVDFAFFSSNVLKVFDGGWVPLAIGFSLITVMTTWRRGRALLHQRWQQDSLPLASFLGRLPQSRIVRVPGVAVFMTGNPEYTPSSLLHNLKHNKVLHETVVFVTVRNPGVPFVGDARRAKVEELSEGVYRVLLSFGFMESPNIPRALDLLREQGLPFNPMQISYFLGRETIVAATVPKLGFIRRAIFLFMLRNAISATEFFKIPSDRVVELGVRIAI
ncbi:MULTISPECIES: potassium transporter Kup [Acidiphilium]|uniref:Probable potassium transport system protein Kup n=3 Tax=Acidiphilium TaxID=522 RepID=KUP_ACICJ|nr:MULTISPECIES: potassium transporter Kup [Acidiphilium]A5FUT7.1 RecName: Full=Probable potassium transport system protein Kup [Acidiphilium cryptum JF-5]MBU6356314.1 potassium transporter Kup [Rhodospirillales bacterium]ABQ29369.1 potassium transporter [Acidiphilium cryptum JF-5]EGO95888.1 putative potassium transport system protein kup [Acidiphilium sp. PM]KDM67284.1 putative potassium transport system protein Kup [Acidiphilium sp. JA12-A1]MBS3023705.1 potassium transporter Kup [Acidiphili